MVFVLFLSVRSRMERVISIIKKFVITIVYTVGLREYSANYVRRLRGKLKCKKIGKSIRPFFSLSDLLFFFLSFLGACSADNDMI